MKKILVSERDFKGQCKGLKVGIVVSTFNEFVTSRLEQGCVDKLLEYVDSDGIELVQVPGAVELPIVLQRMAKLQKFDVLIALGAVIRGETSHYDYVCGQASQGCQRVMLDYNVPVIFGVLTTENREQALARVGGNRGHMGVESAVTALKMVLTLRQI